MKNSGIQWIGDIPQDWNIVKVKNYYKIQTGFTPDTKNFDYYDNENGYDWISISDMNNKKIVPSTTKKKISQLYIDKFNPKIIPKGSLLYSFKLSVGQVAFADRNIYSNEAIASFLYNDNINLNFLYYSSFLIVENANENIYGAKILNQDLINNAYIVFPPIEEQQRIANYLDEKCSKIDETIEKEKAIIEKLKEYKQSLITETVTKGLNPNVPLKDSGIDWIGSIPQHWETVKIKRVANLFNGKEIIAEVEKNENSFNVYGSGGIFKYTNQYLYDGEAVLFGRKGSIGKPLHIIDKFWTVDTMYYCICNQNYINKLLYYILVIFPWDKHTTKTALPSVVGTDIFKCSIPFPPMEEQEEIAKYLDEKCNAIDNAITQRETLIDKLTEYKKSLIYECVTGKKEV